MLIKYYTLHLTQPLKILLTSLILLTASNSFAATDNKVLLKGRYLQFEGGFKIPILQELGTPNMKYSELAIDMHPTTKSWAMGHPAGIVIELIEPSTLGTGDISNWPSLTLARSSKVFESVDKINPRGVFWLDADTILTSGRKSYRSGFTNDWIATVNINNSKKKYYTITAPSNTESDNFHILQALGGGFMRITDTAWATQNAKGNNFLLGRGGYDVLGSPLGPALASWNIGDSNASFLLDYPTAHPARRDRYYTYPNLDLNTYEKVQLPIWKNPDNTDGFWQAGDVGGLAFINHPQVKGIVATHNLARGVLDYRAQGDGGSGSYFSVNSPTAFYSADSAGGNRGDHESETGNATYPDGVYGRVGHVFDPDDLALVVKNEIEPWEVTSKRFEWTSAGVVISDEARNHTKLGGVYWDNERQLLWVTMTSPSPILVAYSIVVDDSREEEPVKYPPGLYEAPPSAPPTNEIKFIYPNP